MFSHKFQNSGFQVKNFKIKQEIEGKMYRIIKFFSENDTKPI